MSTALKAPNPVPDTLTVLVGGPVAGATFTSGLDVATGCSVADAMAAGVSGAATTPVLAMTASSVARKACRRIGTPSAAALIRRRPRPTVPPVHGQIRKA